MILFFNLLFAAGFGLSVTLFVNDQRYAEASFVVGLAGILLLMLGFATGEFGRTP